MPSTADAASHAAHSLLDLLSDDELARYGEIARDQANLELRDWGRQAVLTLGAVAASLWSAVKWGLTEFEALGIEAAGFGGSVILGLGSAWILGYSPYRRVRNWALWNRHCKAVRDEQQRRRDAPATGVRGDVAR